MCDLHSKGYYKKPSKLLKLRVRSHFDSKHSRRQACKLCAYSKAAGAVVLSDEGFTKV